MKIEQCTAATASDLWTRLRPRVDSATCLEEAAQMLAGAVHADFKESVVIARLFVTVPFGHLRATNRTFVERLADSAGAKSALTPTTPVLSLIGTHGEESDWNDRHKSKGHMGIPLISAAFVQTIPMIARLLKELGVPLEWVDSHDSGIIERGMSTTAELFFVDDASEATDHKGRKIIAAQEFVSTYGVKSVFGGGGVYGGDRMLAMVIFCRDQFPRSVAQLFLPLIDAFKDRTSARFGTTKIFRDG